MLRGLIDIGSNTVKAFVYDVEKEKCSVKTSTRFYLHLYSHIHNSVIDNDGKTALLDTVGECLIFLHENNCFDCRAFATAALRDAENGTEIVKLLEKKYSIPVEMLTGEQEALCDMLSMKHQAGIKEALGMDIGGGSAQIFLYDEKGLLKSASLPIGALKVAEKFTKNICPTSDEKEAIKSYVKACINAFSGIKGDKIFLMGGSGTEIKRIFPMVTGSEEITPISLEEFFLTLSQMEDIDCFLRKNAQGRERTIMPACVILIALSEFFAAERFVVLQNGVREGYLIKNNFFI